MHLDSLGQVHERVRSRACLTRSSRSRADSSARHSGLSPGPALPGHEAWGIGLLEVLVALALMLVVLGHFAPSFSEWRARQQLRGALAALRLSVMKMRVAAVATGRSHGMVFSLRDGDLVWDLVVDGDGDGVRRADTTNGLDPSLESERRLSAWFPGVRPGRPHGVPPLAGGAAGTGGVALGRSMILAVAPDGSSSSGTIYLCTSAGYGAALRLYGPTGRSSGWWWDRRNQAWEPQR